LSNITIPSGITSINSTAFANCSGLLTINVDTNNQNFRSEGNCLIRRNNNELIVGCQTSVIPTSVTSIGSNSFYGQTNLTSLTIPISITSIANVFSDCSGLTSINVNANNPVYRSEGNCLIQTSDKTLIMGCQTSVIPSSITSIGANAFSGCSNLTSISIPLCVESIGNSSFLQCSNLSSIFNPISVLNIGSMFFTQCYNLTIYAEVLEQNKPAGWSAYWDCGRPVV